VHLAKSPLAKTPKSILKSKRLYRKTEESISCEELGTAVLREMFLRDNSSNLEMLSWARHRDDKKLLDVFFKI